MLALKPVQLEHCVCDTGPGLELETWVAFRLCDICALTLPVKRPITIVKVHKKATSFLQHPGVEVVITEFFWSQKV